MSGTKVTQATTASTVFGVNLYPAAFEAWRAYLARRKRGPYAEHDPSLFDFENWYNGCKQQFEKAEFPERLTAWLHQWHRSGVEAHGEMWIDYHQKLKGVFGGSGVTVAFIGSRGTGKTQLATALGWHAAWRSRSVHYWRASMLFTRIRATYGNNSKETEAAIIRDLVKVGLLVLDEIGEANETTWEGRILANVVCQRHDEGLDTVLISNQSVEALTRTVGESITDRIAEGGGIFKFNWSSFRRPSA